MPFTLADFPHLKPTADIVNFQVTTDEDGDWVVCEANHAFSFMRIPLGHEYCFGADRAKAEEQVRRFARWQAKGNRVTLRTVNTPNRFEAVADTKYGCAW